MAVDDLSTAGRILKRATGYYWIKFPYPNGQRRWEVASFDSRAGMWLLIGSDSPWYEMQLLEVGARIEPPEA